MSYVDLPNLKEVLGGIRSRADRLDASGDWPDEDLRVLSTLAAMRWAVPMEFGGEDLSAIELHFRYEAIASASVTTALILTQRDSAIGIITASDNTAIKQQLLPRLASNEIFTTVGFAQLTTSRQRGGPALRAEIDADRLTLDGEIPWATGAGHSAVLIVGAAMSDGRQILCAMPSDAPGVKIEPPMPLVALRGSHTTTVRCDHVQLNTQQILLGPAEAVLALRQKSLSIGQTFLAMGLTSGALELIRQIDSPTARSAHEKLSTQLSAARAAVLDFCNPAATPDPAGGPVLRGRCIDLALRAAQTCVSLYKGAALLEGHPAQRLAREALFLLVWSCPSPVVECTVDLLSSERPAVRP